MIKSREIILIKGLLSKPSNPLDIAVDKGLTTIILVKIRKAIIFAQKINRLFKGFIFLSFKFCDLISSIFLWLINSLLRNGVGIALEK